MIKILKVTPPWVFAWWSTCHNWIMIGALLSCILPAFYRHESWGKTWHKNCTNESSIWLLTDTKMFPVEAIKESACEQPMWRKIGLFQFPCPFSAMRWVIRVQACWSDRCVMVWDQSSSTRDEECSCSGRSLLCFSAYVICCFCILLSNSKECCVGIVLKIGGHKTFCSEQRKCRKKKPKTWVGFILWWTLMDTGI